MIALFPSALRLLYSVLNQITRKRKCLSSGLPLFVSSAGFNPTGVNTCTGLAKPDSSIRSTGSMPSHAAWQSPAPSSTGQPVSWWPTQAALPCSRLTRSQCSQTLYRIRNCQPNTYLSPYRHPPVLGVCRVFRVARSRCRGASRIANTVSSARSVWSGWSTGAFQNARMASPINLSMVPSRWKIS